jgi:hypothetical protein
MDNAVAVRSGSGLKALVQRRPVAAFLALALGSVYVLSVIPILMQYNVIAGKTFPARLAWIWRGSPLPG